MVYNSCRYSYFFKITLNIIMKCHTENNEENISKPTGISSRTKLGAKKVNHLSYSETFRISHPYHLDERF